MKPPSRRRIRPSRFLDVKKTEAESKFRPSSHRLKQRTLLLALKHQTESNTELDVSALQRTIPKWTLLQIQNVIKFLKECVVKRVYLQVQKQRRAEQKTKVPIELWTELAQKMAGVHVETISSAFSQMLVIAATEPCSLRHSDPPRTTECQSTPASGLRTIPLRPLRRCHSSSPSRMVVPPGEGCKTPQSRGNDADPNPTVQTNTVTSPSDNAEFECSELLQKTKTDSDPATSSTSATTESLLSQCVSKSTPPVSASNAVSTAVPLITSDAVQPDKPSKSAQSGQACQFRPNGMKSVVDFEKIYQFISNIVLNKHTQPLTAMESAVLLDMLMSLPEELPLLDCKELQHHLLQIHSCLNAPAVVNLTSTEETEQQTSCDSQNANRPDAPLQTQTVQSTGEDFVQEGAVATESSVQASAVYDGGDWVNAGICPLNPFMVPVTLLKRQ
ncbi:snRNA-activating protein complex subunit 2 [Bagarius yarrelli]|uniref:snRNA-activating protein complex subunit 2 n=1 Tax=Bagarius yarrelli TaxID=175774 RepID=A0A556TYZ4_BAGYA|nr:snRNA-activating protein complex subunit 2 [Bagarius yarrelli]